VTTYTYDTTGRRLTAVAPKGNATGADPAAFTTRYDYDAAGRLLSTSVADPAGAQITAQTYDADGRLATQTDQLGKVTHYTYDAAGRLTMLTRPDGSTQTQTEGNGKVTSYTEDALSRLTSVTDPPVLDRIGPARGYERAAHRPVRGRLAPRRRVSIRATGPWPHARSQNQQAARCVRA
jgi:YD repeat-containing protein